MLKYLAIVVLFIGVSIAFTSWKGHIIRRKYMSRKEKELQDEEEKQQLLIDENNLGAYDIEDVKLMHNEEDDYLFPKHNLNSNIPENAKVCIFLFNHYLNMTKKLFHSPFLSFL